MSKLYTWSFIDLGVKKGLVTTERLPSEMSLSDIVGMYVADGQRLPEWSEAYTLGIDGIESISSHYHWTEINTDSDDNILRIYWEYEDESGEDVFYFDCEVIDEDCCLSAEDYINIWYEKSGRDSSFLLGEDNLADFYSYLDLWKSLDSYDRILWHDGMDYWMTSPSNLETIFPIGSLSSSIYMYNPDNLDTDQLIRMKDIPKFSLYKIGIDGAIKYPNIGSGKLGECVAQLNYFCPEEEWEEIPSIYYETNFESNKSVYANAYNGIIYNNLDMYNGIPDYFQLVTSVKTYDGTSIDTSNSYGTDIDVRFANGHTYTFNVVSKTTSSSGGQGSYTVNLNSQWQKSSSISNPNTTLYDGVYESYSNHNVNNGTATMTITIRGYKKFSLYIRSNAETYYDYVMVSQLDKSITGSTSYSDTTLVKAHTRGNQQPGTALSNYTLVEYDNMTGSIHTITIVYRKDSGVNSGTDKGYVLISKNNESYSTSTTSKIIANCNNTESFSLAGVGMIESINYSNLNFKTNDAPGVYLTISYTSYFIGTGSSGSIRLSNYKSDIKPTTNLYGDFISLDGSMVISGNVPYDVYEDNAHKYFRFAQESLSRVYGQECYFRTKMTLYSGEYYMCFHVIVNSTSIQMIYNSIGDCTLWLNTNLSNNTISMYTRNGNAVRLCPTRTLDSGPYPNGALSGCFAHGYLYSGRNSDYYGVTYNNSNIGTDDISELYLGEVFSLIPTMCTSVYDVYRYMTGSPSIDIRIMS